MKVRQVMITAAALGALAAPAAAMPLQGDDGAVASGSQSYVPFASDFGSAPAQVPVSVSGIGVGDDSAFATTSQSAISPQALHALGARYQAMAKFYGAAQPTDRAVEALGLRYEAMAKAYGASGAAARPDDRAGVHGVGGEPVSAPATSSGSFDWTWVAAGSSSGLVLLLTGGALVLLVTRRHSRAALG